MSELQVNLKNISKRYPTQKDWVFKNFNLSLKPSESLAIMGPSGKGKTTLMNLIGLLDQDFLGEYRLAGMPIHKLDSRKVLKFRNQFFGFVFQSPHLIPHLNILDNISLPLYYQGFSNLKIRQKAKDLLAHFDMQEFATRLPQSLSGGQQQRISLIRGVIHNPQCILADEPTSHLDEETQNKILEQLFFLQKKIGSSIILITHQKNVALSCDRWISL